MNRDDVLSKVKSIVSEELEIDINDIGDDSSYTEDLGVDSLDMVDLVMALETAFSAEISDEQSAQLTTVDKTVDYIIEHTKNYSWRTVLLLLDLGQSIPLVRPIRSIPTI